MWKKLVKVLVRVLIGLFLLFIGIFIGNSLRTCTNNSENAKFESEIDSLENVCASYESISDSLFFQKRLCDSLRNVKIKEVTKYKFSESVKFLEKNIHDTIQVEVLDSDTVAIMRNSDLIKINKIAVEADYLKKELQLSDSIIGIKDSIIGIKNQEIIKYKEDRKKAKRKAFLFGAGTGAAIASLLWMLL